MPIDVCEAVLVTHTEVIPYKKNLQSLFTVCLFALLGTFVSGVLVLVCQSIVLEAMGDRY